MKNKQRLTIDSARREVFVGDRSVSLTRLEFNLLHLLHTDRRAWTCADILNDLWGDDADEVVDSRTVAQHISRLRRKLAQRPKGKPGSGRPATFDEKFIATVHGIGYKISAGA